MANGRRFHTRCSCCAPAPPPPADLFPQAFDDFNTKTLDPCPNCGRTFVPRALEVHLRSCKPRSPSPSKLPQPTSRVARQRGQNSSRQQPDQQQRPSQRQARPGTYNVKERKSSSSSPPEEEAPSRLQLAQMVQRSPALGDAEARRRLAEFIKQLGDKVED